MQKFQEALSLSESNEVEDFEGNRMLEESMRFM